MGDAPYIVNGAQGGNDTLTGGSGNDILWGDGRLDETAFGGEDVFVFGPGSGQDVIRDFRQTDDDHEGPTVGDRIDVSAYGFDDIGDLVITDDGVNTTISFGGGNLVVLEGFADATLLTTDDFIFA